MLDLLTIEEDAAAAEQGWGLYHVYDAKWVIRILPTTANELVVNLAKQGQRIPIKALRLLVQGTGVKK